MVPTSLNGPAVSGEKLIDPLRGGSRSGHMSSKHKHNVKDTHTSALLDIQIDITLIYSNITIP